MRPLLRALLALAVAGPLTGCLTHYAVPDYPREALRRLGPRNVVEVVDKRGTVLELVDARAVGDSLVGWRSTESAEQIALPLDDIVSIARRETDVSGSVVLASVAVLGGLFLFAIFVAPHLFD